MVYDCKICNYTTKSNSNYHKHLKTRKHKKNYVEQKTNGIELYETKHYATQMQHYSTKCNNNVKIDFIDKEFFVCKYCNKEFGKHQSYYRHMKYYCKNKKDEDIISNNNHNYRYLMEKIIDIKDENRKEMKDFFMEVLSSQKENMKETMTLILDDKNRNNEFLLNSNKSNSVNNFTQNNTMNNTNYVLNYINYSEADSMNNIKDKFKLTRDEFIKASLTKGYKGALMEKANNIIIKPYLKSQEKRPMQTVDIARKKALYKDNQSENWTFTPKITLDQCFNEFHLSALNHQDQTINENPNLVIDSIEDNLYKQTYFIPTEIKDKESIYRDVKNHIYKNTQVKRIEENSFLNNPEIDLISYKDNSIYDSNDKYKEMYNCGKIFLAKCICFHINNLIC